MSYFNKSNFVLQRRILEKSYFTINENAQCKEESVKT